MGDLKLQIFSDRLKELRLSMNSTQVEFVEDMSFTASALSAYEKNLKNPSISVAIQIAEKYNVSIDWLCGLSEQRNIENECSSYSDIINTLLTLEKYIDFTVEDVSPFNQDEFESLPIYHLVFSDNVLCEFFKEWKKMRELYQCNTIDYLSLIHISEPTRPY